MTSFCSSALWPGDRPLHRLLAGRADGCKNTGLCQLGFPGRKTSQLSIVEVVTFLHERSAFRYTFCTIMEERYPLSSPLHADRSEEHTSELQSLRHLVCRLL